MQSGSLPTGFNSGTSNGTPWAAQSGFNPYFSWQYPRGAQAISGTAWLTGGLLPAASGTIVLYANGQQIMGGKATTNASGFYKALVDAGTVNGSMPLGGTLTLSGGSSIVGATYTGAPTMSGSNVVNFDITQGLFRQQTSATTSSALPDFSTPFGSANYGSITTTLAAASATQQIEAAGAFTVDSALSNAGGLTVKAVGDVTMASGGSITSSGGNTKLQSTTGDVIINTAQTHAGSNTLTYDAADDVLINAAVTVTGAGKVAIVTGDVTGTGVGTSAGDYDFGLTANGFTGSLRFTGTAGSGQALSINGSNYKLLYSLADLGTVNNVAGNYALARPLDLSSAGTLSASPAGNLTGGANFTGLGNTVNAMTLSSGNATVGLFGSVSAGATLRDIGVTNSTLTTTHATVSGGLLAGLNDGGTVKNAYATGTASGSAMAQNSAIGLLVGRTQGNGSASLIDNTFAIGSVNVAGVAANAGGLVGSSRGFSNANSVISRSFAIADVASTTTSTSSGYTRLGVLVGESVQGSGPASGVLTDVFAMGTVRSNNSADFVGGLAGAVGSNSQTTNAMSISLVVAPGANTGGLTGFKSGTGTVTNSYYDSGTSGQSDTGKGTAQTTAQLQSGGLPSGFSSANWTTGADGLYPYLTSFFPNGIKAISGTAYQNAGTAAVGSTLGFYAGGAAIGTLGTVHAGANGYYYAITPTGTLPAAANSNIGATLTLYGAGTVSGLTYTGLPTVSGGNITNLDVRQGVFLSSTNKTTNSALQTDIAATLGSGTYTGLQTTLAGALWQINASGNFSVNSALSHAGNTGLFAGGNLSLDAAVTATGSTLMLSADGTVTDGASGAINASNLALLGGTVTLDGASNNVTTLAASGVASLLFQGNGNVTVGAIGPLHRRHGRQHRRHEQHAQRHCGHRRQWRRDRQGDSRHHGGRCAGPDQWR